MRIFLGLCLLLATWLPPVAALESHEPLDAFTRANTGPPPSANWTTNVLTTHSNGLTVVSNTLRGVAGATSSAWWNVTPFPPDQAVSLRMPDMTSTLSTMIRMYVRVTSPNIANATDGYMCRHVAGTANQVQLRRLDNSTESSTLASAGVTWTDGDSIGCVMIGSQLCGWKTVSGVWTSLVCTTDTTYTAAGYTALAFNGDDIIGDDFWAGAARTRRRPAWLGRLLGVPAAWAGGQP